MNFTGSNVGNSTAKLNNKMICGDDQIPSVLSVFNKFHPRRRNKKESNQKKRIREKNMNQTLASTENTF